MPLKDGEKEEKIIENMLPLAINVENKIAYRIKKRNNLDDVDLGKNIDQGVEGNLSPRQIERLKLTQGIQKKGERG